MVTLQESSFRRIPRSFWTKTAQSQSDRFSLPVFKTTPWCFGRHYSNGERLDIYEYLREHKIKKTVVLRGVGVDDWYFLDTSQHFFVPVIIFPPEYKHYSRVRRLQSIVDKTRTSLRESLSEKTVTDLCVDFSYRSLKSLSTSDTQQWWSYASPQPRLWKKASKILIFYGLEYDTFQIDRNIYLSPTIVHTNQEI